MSRLRAFALEDFFREYEHRRDLINLASSDASPWTLQEMIDHCPRLKDVLDTIDLKYPDVQGVLVPALRTFCRPPRGMDVLPTSGTAEAIFLVLAALRDQQDVRPRIALPSPSYGAFSGISTLLDCEVAYYGYEPDSDWSLNVAQLIQLCGQCDVVVVNNPHNPTGHLAGNALISDISEAINRRGGILLVDEVFRLEEDCRSAIGSGSHTVVVGSLSKVYGLPGLRVGWIVADETRLGSFRTLQQYATLSPNSFAVMLGATVLDDIDRFSRRELLKENRRAVRDWASKHSESLRVVPSEAGTTAILEIESAAPEEELFSAFLEKGVLLVPGSRCFGVESRKPWFRLGYGARNAALRAGLDAIVEALSET